MRSHDAILILCGMLTACHGHTQVPEAKVWPRLDAQEHYRVYLSGFDETDTESIHVAVTNWNEAFHGHVVIDFEHRGYTADDAVASQRHRGIIISKVDSTCPYIPTSPAGTLAWVDSIGGDKVWVIRDRIDTRDLTTIVMHEFGHVFGALDDMEPESKRLMAMQWSDKPACIDAQTAKEVETYLDLSPLSVGVTCR